MIVSLDWGGCYLEHREYFDAMAVAMQKNGHQVGILTGERESKKNQILGSLGFTPDFMMLWPEFDAIPNGAQWKAQQMEMNHIGMHFDDDASDMKRWTDLWICKVLNSGNVKKF